MDKVSATEISVARSYKFPLIMLAGIVIGSLLGWFMGKKAIILKPFGDIFLNLLFCTVTPLIFVSIAGAVAGMKSASRFGRVLVTMLVVFTATGIVASAVMIAGVKLFPPGIGLKPPSDTKPVAETEAFSLADKLVAAVTVSDFRDLFSRKNLLPLIIFAVLFGFATRISGDAGTRIAGALESSNQILIKLVEVLMWGAPIGLGAYFAYLAGEYGPDLFGLYGRALALYYVIAILYFIIFFTIYAWIAGGARGIRSFWKEIQTPAVFALASGSSVAAIPANLAACARLNVPRDIRELMIPMGATIHMDGSCLSAILKIAAVSTMFGVSLDGWVDYATAIGVAILSGTVMAGIPGGGFAGEMMIVSLYGLPPQAFAVMSTLGTLVDPPATMLNCTGDTVCSMMASRVLEGPDWMDKQQEEHQV
jgi:Na+/H+-dicarboxylate symporter